MGEATQEQRVCEIVAEAMREVARHWPHALRYMENSQEYARPYAVQIVRDALASPLPAADPSDTDLLDAVDASDHIEVTVTVREKTFRYASWLSSAKSVRHVLRAALLAAPATPQPEDAP